MLAGRLLLSCLAVAVASETPSSDTMDDIVDYGVIVGGALGIVAAGICCIFFAQRLAMRTTARELAEMLTERNERRRKMGLSELVQATADDLKKDTLERL